MSDNAQWWDQRIQLDPELEHELDAFWAEEQERAAAEKHKRQIRAIAKAKRSRTHTEAPSDVTLGALCARDGRGLEQLRARSRVLLLRPPRPARAACNHVAPECGSLSLRQAASPPRVRRAIL